MPADTAGTEQAQDDELRRIGCWAGGLDALHARIAPLWGRETRWERLEPASGIIRGRCSSTCASLWASSERACALAAM
jgi:hypothetical protein